MTYKRLENILLYTLLFIATGVYLYTVAPTFSFWDCGEFIAASFTMAVSHPPGAPLFVLLGRVWIIVFAIISAILPISKDVGWHMNLLGLSFAVLSTFLLYKLMLKIFRMWRGDNNQIASIIIAFATCLGISFFYTYWLNALETEVYSAAIFFVVLITYLAILWYESVKQGTPKHGYILLAFYIIFLSSSINLTPFLLVIPFYIFVYVVQRKYLKDMLFLLLGIFQIVSFALVFLVPASLYLPAIGMLGVILLLGIILPLNNPIKYRNWRFFWVGILLVVSGISSELYLPIRSRVLTELYKDKNVAAQYLAGKNIAPRINECDPGENFTAFNNALHRSQYGPQRIIPRQTQDESGYSLIEGYFWQGALFIRYLSMQPLPEDVNWLFRAFVLTLFYALGIWGLAELYKREKKIFIFMILILFMLSFAMVGYLNLKFSPSDTSQKHQPREVRERDYFFVCGFTYFGILMGLGFYGFADWLKRASKNKRLANISGLSGVIAFSLIPLMTNIRYNNRYGNFIPKDYGYNMLVSCDDGGILFTNGDNDTFPLWIAQEVFGIKRSVIVANLSLINTDWYIRQLKYWGAPVSFSDEEIKLLEPIYDYRNRRVIYVKDIMIRDLIATNAGIKLKRKIERGQLILSDAYFLSQEEFAAGYLKGYKGERPIYFASTVSDDNYRGLASYLRLEGIVYRMVGDSVPYPYHIDIEKTEDFFYKVYRYTGVFDSKKQQVLARILPDFERRKKEREMYNSAVVRDENTVRLYSNYAAGLFNLGLVERDRADIQGALDAWNFAVLFEPYPAYPFLYNLGLLYAQFGMVDSADNYFSMIETNDPQIITQIGSVLNTIGEYDRALAYFQRALAINPRFPQAHFGLFTVYMAKNDTASAVQILQNWLQINPRDSSAYRMLQELAKK